jgi:hypothetical protein
LPAQIALVGLDDGDVVGAAAEEVVGMFALGVHGVAGHDRPGQVGDAVEHGLEAGDLVGLVTDVHLGLDQAGGVVQGGEQVDLAAVCPGGTAQALAVHGQTMQLPGGGRPAAVA